MENTMTPQQRLQYFKVALATLDIHFEKDKPNNLNKAKLN